MVDTDLKHSTVNIVIIDTPEIIRPKKKKIVLFQISASFFKRVGRSEKFFFSFFFLLFDRVTI